MKIRKTRQDRRETYRYEAYLENDNGEYTKECIELKPGTDGVTEAWIKTLHSLDDHEVYLNCKNGHPPLTEAEKAAKRKWELLWSSIFVTLVAKKYHESVTLPSGLRMVYDNH